MDWLRTIVFFFTKQLSALSDSQIAKRYKDAGATFGDAVSYIYMGECIGFADLLTEWQKLETEWVRRGFRTHSLDEFVALGGYGVQLKDFPARRKEDETPIFHAKIYREMYLGKIEPVAPIERMLQGPLETSYVLPSTELRPPDQQPKE